MRVSLYKNRYGILLMILAAINASLGQLLWKIGTESGIWYLIIGFIFYGLGALLLIIAFRFGELSVLHPFLSLNFVFALYLGYAVLGEEITTIRILGVIIIIFGVILIGGSSHE